MRPPGPKALALLAFCVGWAAQSAVRADEGIEGITAVASTVSDDYVRAKLSDGSFAPEAYVFGKGGDWGGPMIDGSIDRMGFLDIAHVIAQPLASQNYLSAKDPAKTRLLIMVYWGTTSGTSDTSNSDAYQGLMRDQTATPPMVTAPAGLGASSANSSGNKGIQGTPNTYDSGLLTMLNMQNKLRDLSDIRNAQLLGYGSALPQVGMQQVHTAFSGYRDDLLTELEYNRYFVVLMAYDFQVMWKKGKHKLLWETRFSVDQRHNQFDRALPEMARYASRYFGQDSHGLLRNYVHEGQVKVGEPTLIDLFSPTEK